MKIKSVYHRYMLRPLIYLTAQRLMIAGILCLALYRFVQNGPRLSLIAGFLSVAFALLAYLVYLRMDGIRLPRMKPIKVKKDPMRNYGDMAEHIDDDLQVSLSDLEDDERDFCSLVANLVNLAIWLVLSFIL